jgi:hypothetical protein
MEMKRKDIVKYYDNLSRILTYYENDEILEKELYWFMVETHRYIAGFLN